MGKLVGGQGMVHDNHMGGIWKGGFGPYPSIGIMATLLCARLLWGGELVQTTNGLRRAAAQSQG